MWLEDVWVNPPIKDFKSLYDIILNLITIYSFLNILVNIASAIIIN